MPRLSIVIPAFNEAERLGPTLERVLAYLAGLPAGAEVLVVDDGSTDGTATVAQRFADRGVRLVRLAANRGKGAALKAGVLASRGDEVLLCDADLSTPIEDYARLSGALERSPIVVGSRAVAGSRITRHQPWYRELMGKTFNLLVRAMVVSGLRDTQCGFKLLRGDVARMLFAELSVDRFAYDVELIWLARRRGLEVVEVGVTWHDSPASRVHPLRDSWSMLRDLARMRWRHRGAGRLR